MGKFNKTTDVRKKYNRAFKPRTFKQYIEENIEVFEK